MTDTRTYRGQRFAALDRIPHTCLDGRETTLVRWVGLCAQCGDPFAFNTPAKASKFQPNRRCQRCKCSGKRVRGAA